MKLPRSVIAALVIFALLFGYFLIRTVARAADGNDGAERSNIEEQQDKPVAALKTVHAEPRAIVITLNGLTEAEKMVAVRAETTGIVTDAPVSEGSQVRRGTLLCGLGIDARQARVAEAEAAVAARQVDYDAAQELVLKGWTSSNSAAAAKASLDAAKAARDTALIELRRTRITAPFDGVFETRSAEIGDFSRAWQQLRERRGP